MHRLTKLIFSLFLSSLTFAVAAVPAQPDSTAPSVTVSSQSEGPVGLYVKFEVTAELSNAVYSNPYDPDQVDLRGVFLSPSGKEWGIYGFYDDFQGRGLWKVRFAANETGEWQYYLTLANQGTVVQTETHTFTVDSSAYHGWLRLSDDNPHYFEHDNGEPFYGVGAYYPWGINEPGLDVMQESGANFFGYWNIMYGNESGIIESLESGLGRYDQGKCGRIDQLLEWAEERDMKMMLAIWPHDLLCATLGGWAKQWDSNPYKEITTVNEFYGSEEAWEYQEKQYRYLIARWGYSHSLGVWEIINEITGTDGWANGYTQEATNWMGRVSDFLKEHDPFGRPTTGSQHGGYYWPEGYAHTDIPNVHVYETSWAMEYQGNPHRSSHYLYHFLSNQFWNDFAKPAIFGEAGFSDSYGRFATPSTGYTQLYHNAIWASWASGIAATPVWWDFGSRQIMSDAVMQQMLAFSRAAHKPDYRSTGLTPAEQLGGEVDAYYMRDGARGFGWVRETLGNPLAGRPIYLNSLPDTTYEVKWMDTWLGLDLPSSVGIPVGDSVMIPTPEDFHRADYAFFLSPLGEGGPPESLSLLLSKPTLLSDGASTATITCLLRDAEGLISNPGGAEVTLNVEGPGELLTESPITTETGYLQAVYRAGIEQGEVKILASSPGLHSDTAVVTLKDHIMMDDFDSYSDMSQLDTFWETQPGTDALMQLWSSGDRMLRVTYSVGNTSPPYAGIQRKIFNDYSGTNTLRFWLTPDASNRTLAVILRAGTAYWQYDYPLTGGEPEYVQIPFSEFMPSSGDDPVDAANLTRISFSVLQGAGGPGLGEFFLDNIALGIGTVTGIASTAEISKMPDGYELYQNYPNPFNPFTTIEYELPEAGPVKLVVYNALGQKVDTLVNEQLAAGRYETRFDGRNYASGVYLLRFTAGEYAQTRRMMLVK